MSAAEVTADTWDQVVLNAAELVVVDVWAPWCLPCRRIEPMLAKVADEFGPRVRCVRLDADTAPDLVARYGVLSLPTLLLFRGGQEVGRVAGVPKRDSLRTLVATNLGES